MSFGDEWRAIAARISGLRVAGELSARFQAINSSDDSYGSGAELGAQCKEIVSKLREFEERYRALMPKSAAEALARFLQLRVVKGLVAETDGNRAVRSGLPALVGFESELTFHLSGQQERIKAHAERAFQHLQQIIVADEDARSKWQAAFGKSEPAVERLGGTHLLWHGVYAFKVVAEKAETDLVFNEPVDLDAAARASEGLVLTEWKVGDEQNAGAKYDEAQAQCNLYSEGALGGLELRGYRYLVLVTKARLKAKFAAKEVVDGVTYRRINIAVNPDSPSVDARRSRGKSN
jgi:hypothetical protein